MRRRVMQAIVDGIIYQYQSHGGASRIYSEILPRMCEVDNELNIMLLTSGRPRQSLPTHERISHHPLFPIDQLLRPGRLWWPVIPRAKALVQRIQAGSVHGSIWHSTYYTRQENWQGPQVVTALDMIEERFA